MQNNFFRWSGLVLKSCVLFIFISSTNLFFNVSYWPIFERMMINFKYGFDYGARQRFKSNTFVLNLLFNPNLLTSKQVSIEHTLNYRFLLQRDPDKNSSFKPVRLRRINPYASVSLRHIVFLFPLPYESKLSTPCKLKIPVLRHWDSIRSGSYWIQIGYI